MLHDYHECVPYWSHSLCVLFRMRKRSPLVIILFEECSFLFVLFLSRPLIMTSLQGLGGRSLDPCLMVASPSSASCFPNGTSSLPFSIRIDVVFMTHCEIVTLLSSEFCCQSNQFASHERMTRATSSGIETVQFPSVVVVVERDWVLNFGRCSHTQHSFLRVGDMWPWWCSTLEASEQGHAPHSICSCFWESWNYMLLWLLCYWPSPLSAWTKSFQDACCREVRENIPEVAMAMAWQVQLDLFSTQLADQRRFIQILLVTKQCRLCCERIILLGGRKGWLRLQFEAVGRGNWRTSICKTHSSPPPIHCSQS